MEFAAVPRPLPPPLLLNQLVSLTPRERLLLGYLARGRTTDEIATRLREKVRDVAHYQERLRGKLLLPTADDLRAFADTAQRWLPAWATPEA